MLLKPAHVRGPSVNKFQVEKLSLTVELGTLRSIKSGLDSEKDMNSQTRLVSEDGARKSCDGKDSNIKSDIEKSEKGEIQISRMESTSSCEGSFTDIQISRGEATPTPDGLVTVDQISRGELTFTPARIITGNQTSRQGSTITPERIIIGNQISRREPNLKSSVINTGNQFSRRESNLASSGAINGNRISISKSTSSCNVIVTGNQTGRESTSIASEVISRNQLSRREATSANDRSGPNVTITDIHVSRRGFSYATDENVTIVESQITKGTSIASDDGNITESLLQAHDIFLSTLRWCDNFGKRMTLKMQLVPCGNCQIILCKQMKSVVLWKKMEILTLDLFSGLLPVLMGLLDSKTERHVNISLDMLLKLVAVFGPMIHSTVSAPRGVGVDLHAEQRRECCNQCFIQLQKNQKLLPPLVRLDA
ncbi:Transducin/WD40 repeat-like superfamily protein isoform 2 [Hibiscus syriacus]|uniref:Transducin/WD40 repeat-like superfamily protein isoform 2 n=1 Tax=Hibiscus syriacus TaxID=106335 RepID=A0A6A3D1U2_HIBSY|nr:Transducin/WD40 repeat-like superfamily protein isoform 2 [Hibiscus syriacus]